MSPDDNGTAGSRAAAGTIRRAIARVPQPAPQVVGALALLAFLLLAATAGAALRTNTVDDWAARSAHTLAIQHRWMVRLARGVTFLGSTPCLIAVVAGVGLLLWMRRRPQLAITLVLWSIVSSLLVTLIKMLSAERARCSRTRSRTPAATHSPPATPPTAPSCTEPCCCSSWATWRHPPFVDAAPQSIAARRSDCYQQSDPRLALGQ
jgi:hypothetical protein